MTDALLRIALCADGRSPHTTRWANWLAGRGHEIVMVWDPDQSTHAAREAFHPAVAHVEADAAPLVAHSPRGSIAAHRRLRALGRSLAPDLVHGLYLQVHGWTAADLAQPPLVLSALGSDAMALGASPPGGFKARVVDRLSQRRTVRDLRAADAVLTDSQALADRLRAVAGVESRIVRFGVEAAAATEATSARWRERLDIGDGAPVLLSTRLVKPLYNIDSIIEAFAGVLQARDDAVLVLKDFEPFGDPAYRRHCLELAERLEVTQSLRVVGELPRNDLLELYGVADVYVSVPSTDGTAVSIFEAMAAGSAVVAGDVPGIDRSILRNGETCVLVPVRDVGALTSALTRLLDDDALRSRLVDAGKATAAAIGDFDEELAKAEALYRELVRRRRSR